MKRSLDPVKISKVMNISIKDAYAIIGIELLTSLLPKTRLATIHCNLDKKTIKYLNKLAKLTKISKNTLLVYPILNKL